MKIKESFKKIAGLIIAITGLYFAHDLYTYSLNEESKLINDLRKINLLLPLLPSLLVSAFSFIMAFFLINGTQQINKLNNESTNIVNIPNKNKRISDKKINHKIGLAEVISFVFGALGIIIGIIYFIYNKNNKL